MQPHLCGRSMQANRLAPAVAAAQPQPDTAVVRFLLLQPHRRDHRTLQAFQSRGLRTKSASSRQATNILNQTCLRVKMAG